MLNAVGISLVLVSALLIAIADAMIKKTSAGNAFSAVILNPWFLAILALYFVQVLLAIYIFIHKGDLAVYGNIFVVFYSILMVIIGTLVFREHISATQSVGIVLALVGAVLINGSI
ncbi:MAG: hypothetical protein U1D26_02805 [Patescibacteria group bacterium]|nr:hypothetical protein [bacterium]MDZ4227386.1 hypothetical protein [Patescibacteria group bacterium]